MNKTENKNKNFKIGKNKNKLVKNENKIVKNENEIGLLGSPAPTVHWVSDQVAKIQSVTPDEINLNGYLCPRNFADPYIMSALADPGAGSSYLLLPESMHDSIPIERVLSDMSVRFADHSQQRVHHRFVGTISLTALDSETVFELHDINLFVIPVPSSSGVPSGLQVILGRDLINAFKLDIYNAKRAMIGDVCLFDGDAVNGADLFPLEFTDPVHHLVHLNSPDEGDEVSPPLPISFREEPLAPFGRAHIAIPWRDAKMRPPRQEACARVRDRVCTQRLTSQELALYEEARNVMVDGGYAEVLTSEQAQLAEHFIPARPVFKSSSVSTKCRICLSAIAINRSCFPGPQSGDSLQCCLLKFRSFEWVAIFDLDKAFWQVKYEPDCKPWFCTWIAGTPIRFSSMIFGSNFSPSGLESTLRHIYDAAITRLTGTADYATDEPPRPDSVSVKNYVDDYHSGNRTSPSALIVQTNWYRWFLCQFGFPSSKLASNVNVEGFSSPTVQSYLGYKWDTASDTLAIKAVEDFVIPARLTLRDVVSCLARFFDPLGINLGIQLQARIIVRASFEERKAMAQLPSRGLDGWNFIVSDCIRESIVRWQSQLSQACLHVPRFIDTEEVHIFVDGSQVAWVYEIYDRHGTFVTSRGGLAGTRQTIPQIELVSVFHALTDWEVLHESIGSHTRLVTVYSDSECTVHRLRRPSSKLPKFEWTRICKIRNIIRNSAHDISVTHLPGCLNAADFHTRPGLSTVRPTIDWPTILMYRDSTDTVRFCKEDALSDLELCTEEAFDEVHMILRSEARRNRADTLETAPPALIPVIAPSLPTDGDPPDRDPSLNRIDSIRQHHIHFKEIFDTWSGEQSIDHLGLRRIDNKIPLHDGDSTIVDLITQIHAKLHQGIHGTTAALNRDFRFSHMHKLVKRVVQECAICQRSRTTRTVRSSTGNAEWITNVSQIPVGSVCGIDIATVEKIRPDCPSCFITVTCITTKWIRCAALCTQVSEEVVSALSTLFDNTFYPKLLICDNASNFRSHLFKKFAVTHGMRLAHIPAYASPLGGWYERSHRAVFTGLRALCVTQPSKNWSELLSQSVLMANSRPYDDDRDVEVCPLHLVYPGSDPVPHALPSTTDQEIANLAGVAHLLRPITDLAELQSKLKIKTTKLLRKYEAIFRDKRYATRLRMQKFNQKHEFLLNSYVRVFRPCAVKTSAQWSIPRKIVEIPSPSTRTILKEDGTTTLEWIGNLSPAGSVP